jgi:FkbM family methyltransferase
MMKTIDFNEKQNIAYCIPIELRDEQIKINIRKVKDRLEPKTGELMQDPVAIVCFAPSLIDTWEELRKFKYIMTCSGAHKFLVEKGIIPTWHVELEPRPHKVKMLGIPQKETEYLIASTIHPNYLDYLNEHNAKVRLWHIFANEKEGAAVLPRGEWMICGGSSVGLRCMTLARFLGFTDFHVFGMDGNMRQSGSHATFHPNAPNEQFETEYGGRKYLTTPSMLFCAKETFKELDQMPDVKAIFYGDGLVQDMAKDYVPKKWKSAEIAYNKPVLISPEYIELNRKLHEENPLYGMGGSKHAETVLKIYNHPDINTILDYGCGKGMLAKALKFPIWEYDPAIPEKSATPQPADLVVCTDVLEHIEPDKLNVVLDDLKRCVKQVGYFVISTRKAVKTYANGQNTHLIVQGKEWWEKKLQKFFNVAKVVEAGSELQFIIAPKQTENKQEQITETAGVKFYTPNEFTKWRAETLLTKEPVTIEWLKGMRKGAVMYDVGACIGSYSLFAGVNGVKVYAFEPEPENFSMLVRNMELNNIEPRAYCIAASDTNGLGELYVTGGGAGQSCHSFNQPSEYIKQQVRIGCISMPLDDMVKMGLPHPDYLKIDVDGLEYKVIRGAEKILQNGLTSLLVEVNTNNEEHIKMVEHICSLGYEYSEEQVNKAMRKDGNFKGVAEFIFVKKQRNKKQDSRLARKINDTPLSTGPYPYIYTENIFSAAVYKKLLNELPGIEYREIEKTRGTKGYPKRFIGSTPDFISEIILESGFKESLLKKFGLQDNGYTEDLLLVKDFEGYQIPPHTDSLRKIITALIYLPEDNNMQEEGTTIFVPKQKGYTDTTGRHHSFDEFEAYKTMPFKPNSMFAFARTDNSFHGVFPSKKVRNVLLYNINKE